MQSSKTKLNWLWDVNSPSVHYHQVQERPDNKLHNLLRSFKSEHLYFRHLILT